MVSRNLSVFLGYHARLLLCAYAQLNEGIVNILLCDKLTVFFCSFDSSFIYQILQVSTCETGSCSGYLVKVYII